MSTIYQEIRRDQKKILHKVKEKVKEELNHTSLTERFRGKSIWEKLQGCQEILLA